MYEREDLVIEDGEAVNAVHRTRHPHDFHAADPAVGLTEADVDAQYEAARGKFDHLARRFLGLKDRPGRYLYVFEGFPYVGHVAEVMERLGAGSPEHDWRLLLVGYEDEGDQPYNTLRADLGERIAWTRIPREVRKAGEFHVGGRRRPLVRSAGSLSPVAPPRTDGPLHRRAGRSPRQAEPLEAIGGRVRRLA